jgi:glycosyltransferase involved in cell wall biosynthesis
MARREIAAHVELVGAVPRSEVRGWLERFDILLFPSTCEGSAGAVMEAMATGLPIVTTPNSGTIVRDGVDGFIRPYESPDELAACVDRLASDEKLRLEMGCSARRQAEANDIDAYSRAIADLMRRVANNKTVRH